jgi:hypothetical protein
MANKIVISVGDEPQAPNTTLLALLRDGERPRPGDPGTLADRLGSECQAFMAGQSKVARHRRTAVRGSITLKIDFVSGPDGSHTYAVTTTAKAAKIPPASSMTFADEEGELTGRPVEPLTAEMYRRDDAAKKKTTEKPAAEAKDPKAGAPSSL